MRCISTQTRVRYAETDGQRVAHHATYLVWFELGRAAFLRESGVDYNALEDAGMFVVLVDAQVHYQAPARYDDLVEIRTTLDALRSRDMTFSYEIRRDERMLATGSTRLVLVNAQGRPIALPEALRTALEGPPEPFRGDAIISPVA